MEEETWKEEIQKIESKVVEVLGKIYNKSVPGPDGISY